MKNLSIRSLVATMLILASLGSFIFLNTLAGSDLKPPATDKVEPTEATSEELFLPDVEIIKKVLNRGLRLLPKSL